MSDICAFCDSPDVAEVKHDEKVAVGRKRLQLTGLLKMACPSCGEEYVTDAQLEHNHALFEEAMTLTAEAVTVGQMRSFRAHWNLTQRTASALFGAGESAFGKWESGQLPSGPAALLLQCALHVTGVTEYLARLQRATLPGCPEVAEWHTADGAVTGVLPSFMHKKAADAPIIPARATAVDALKYQPDVVEIYGKAA